MISESKRIVFFGGAGVSTESGVRDYRSEDGLYNTVKEYGVSPETILSHTFFFEHPEIFYDFFGKYFISDAKPNAAHTALAQLEQKGKIEAVITQNIDGLHQKAGSKKVIELHGTSNEFYCSSCKKKGDTKKIRNEIINGCLPLCTCGNLMKPKVVLYEEPLYEGVAEAALESIEKADMLIIGGTSLAVYPAASFVKYFNGKYLAVINKTETICDSRADIVLRKSIGYVLGNLRAD